jgi:hypothetical protein
VCAVLGPCTLIPSNSILIVYIALREGEGVGKGGKVRRGERKGGEGGNKEVGEGEREWEGRRERE